MKSAFSLLICSAVVMIASMAQADSKFVYKYPYKSTQSGFTYVFVKGSIHFPGHGEVPSHKVCVTEDKQTLRASLPASTERVCVREYIDYSDRTHPEKKCDKLKTVRRPARTLETPVTTWERGCVRSHVNRDDTTHPETICDEMGMVRVSQSLTYRIETYDKYTYPHASTPDVSVRSIKTCEQ